MEFVAVINVYVHLTYKIEVNAKIRKYLCFLYEVFTHFCMKSDSCFFGFSHVGCSGSLFHELCLQSTAY